MSIKKVRKEYEEYRKQEDFWVKKFIGKLPDRDNDDPECALTWPMHKGWSQSIEDFLLSAGYDVWFLSSTSEYPPRFCIVFSDQVKEEIAEEQKDNEIFSS